MESNKILGTDAAKYTVVIPKDAKQSEYRLAVNVAAILGIEAPVVTCEEKPELEILVGKTCRTKTAVGKFEFAVAVVGKKVEIVGGSCFALEYAYRYCRANLLQLLADAPAKSAELYCDLDADVIALQEYTDRLLRVEKNYDISPILKENGYSQVYTATGITASATPIFYKTDKFELLESNVINLMTKYSGCGGDKYMTIAVLKQKSDGNIIGVISLHMDYRYSDKFGLQAVYNANREKMAKDACNEGLKIQAKYKNCPVFICGDFNCNSTSTPYQKFLDGGYIDVQGKALETDNGTTAFGHPAWDQKKLIFRTDLSSGSLGEFKTAIDHIMCKGTNVGMVRYDILTDVASASIADHMPHVLDFNLN